MKKDLEFFVILMAVTLPIQYLTFYIFPVTTIGELFEEISATSDFAEVFDKHYRNSLISIFLYMLPGIATAFWVFRIKSIEVTHKWAWVIVSFILEYYILLFYIVGHLIKNHKNEEEKA